jgi:hypothetical protein
MMLMSNHFNLCSKINVGDLVQMNMLQLQVSVNLVNLLASYVEQR